MGAGKVKIALLFALLASWLILGFVAYSSYANVLSQEPADMPLEQAQQDSEGFLSSLLGFESEELPSPCDRIREEQILVYDDHIIINFENAEWAKFTDTNSMDPVIDAGANAIEYVPKSSDEICVGDIVSYNSKYASGTIIHRVIEIGEDENGWYAIMKGDNNPYRDPGKVRFEQVQRVVVGIIY
ncbi:hypothetical protein KY320_00715 [Candidatus Woesearchaeota archaeon]|nr:hypothetical protein [Candidatus Woesearchaeota archaeon]